MSTVDKEKNLQGELAKYKLMVQIITSDPRYAKSLADVSKPSQHDKLAQGLISISWPVGASLGIIYALVQLEFERKYQHPFTILRVNSIVSKMMGRFTRKVGLEFLNTAIGDLIRDLDKRGNINLEVDAQRLEGDNKEAQAARNVEDLKIECQRFVTNITDPRTIAAMPREIRAICNYITMMGHHYDLDYDSVILPLISGFVMLRYVCPAITLPESVNIMPSPPGPQTRKNCTYIAKVLQKLANGEKFESQEPHLLPMNDFLEQNRTSLYSFLKEICTDPHEKNLSKPFCDLIRTVTFEDLHFRMFEMDDLVYLHQLIYEYGFDLIVSLQNEILLTEDRKPVSLISTETDFLKLVKELGAPPDSKGGSSAAAAPASPSKKEEPPTEEKGRKKKGSIVKNSLRGKPVVAGSLKGDNLKAHDAEENQEILIQKSLEFLLKNSEHFELADLERSRFLYQGKNTKGEIPVFYIIMHRLTMEYLSKSDLMLLHIHKTLGPAIEKPYILVVDLSWVDMTDEYHASLYKAVIALAGIIRMSDLLNIQAVYLIHPTRKTLNAMADILSIVEPTTYSKLIKIAYEWSDLMELIEPPKIWIPFVSKKFVPLAYNIIKINHNDKRQDRLIKITNESLLNIDPKNGTIQNEILLRAIEEIKLKADNEILIKFHPESDEQEKARGPGYFTSATNEKDAGKAQLRRYNCFTPQQRELIVDAIFDSAVRAASLTPIQTFPIVKVNHKNKRQERILKLTTDSIINISDRVIKREVPYATIQSFYLAPNDKNILHINFMFKGQDRSWLIESPLCDQLKDSLLDSMHRFKQNVELEIELFKHKDADTIFQKFYANVENKKNNPTFVPIHKSEMLEPQVISQTLADMYIELNTGAKGLTTPLMTDRLKEGLLRNYGMSDHETAYLIHKLDRERKQKLTFDDLVQGWLYMKRQRILVEKRKAVPGSQKPATPPAATASPARTGIPSFQPEQPKPAPVSGSSGDATDQTRAFPPPPPRPQPTPPALPPR